MKRIFYLIPFLFLISFQTQPFKKISIKPPAEFDSVRNEIIQLVKEGKTPSFSVAVLKGKKILWQESFEQSEDSSSITIASNAQYPIASLTKSMSATVLLKLVEKGQISLQDPIEKFLPNTINHHGRAIIKVRDLLNMTAGIPHGWISFNEESPYASYHNDHFIQHYGMSVFPEGIYEYSNYSFGILEAIIEKVTNRPYDVVLKEELFEPLDMKNSFITPNGSNELQNTSTSVFSSKFFPAGAAGVYSTLEDLMKYAQLHMGELKNSIISPSTLEKLHYDKDDPSSILALGWGSISLDDSLSWLVSNGSFRNAANSNLTIVPEHNISVICLANYDYQSSADMMAIRIADVLVPGFAEKAFKTIENYESKNRNKIKNDISKYDHWSGKMMAGNTEYPMNFMLKADSLFASFNNGEWNAITNARVDHQSIIRGGLPVLVKNPITNQIEKSEGSINLLIKDNSLQGYYRTIFRKEGQFDLALPFFIKAEAKPNHHLKH